MTPPPSDLDVESETARLVEQASAHIDALKEILDGPPGGDIEVADEPASARAPALSMLTAVHMLAQATLRAAQQDARRDRIEAELLADRIRSGEIPLDQIERPWRAGPVRTPADPSRVSSPGARPVGIPRGHWISPPTRLAPPSGYPRTAASGPDGPRTRPNRAPPPTAKLQTTEVEVAAKTIAGLGLVLFALLVAGFVVFLLALTGVAHQRSQQTLLARFRHQAGNGVAPVGGTIREGTPVALLDIARLHEREVVVEGTSSGRLAEGPGHLPTSPLPGQLGNSVIAGRRTLFGGPFRAIGSLQPGDKILTTTGQGQAIYRVTSVVHVHRGSNDVIDATGDNQLTLVTGDPAWMPSQRLAVTAALVSTPFAAPAGRPTQLKADETGANGEDQAAIPLLVWALLLLAIALGATWLYLHWARWSTWLITTPILLATLYLFYESLTRLLPASL
jgi:sortase A